MPTTQSGCLHMRRRLLLKVANMWLVTHRWTQQHSIPLVQGYMDNAMLCAPDVLCQMSLLTASCSCIPGVKLIEPFPLLC